MPALHTALILRPLIASNCLHALLPLLVLLFASADHTHPHTVYHLHPSYTDYSRLFAQQVPTSLTLDVTHLGTGNQRCLRSIPCQFYLYLYEPPVRVESDIKATVLLTSGIHGNELLGPTALLYAYPVLRPKEIRIVYFPVMNPSGYEAKRRDTLPEGIDLNRDYPIDNNEECYRGSATRIIDWVFRRYRIDYTVNLHNGADEIGWNWGTKYHEKMPRTVNEPIFYTIGEMLRQHGGQNDKLGIKRFQIGTMTEAVYPAVGTLDDWAYGGSWAESVPYKCRDYSYKPYPKDMHNGLVFLWELGRHNASEGMLGTSEGLNQSTVSTKVSNGYITRALRMLISFVRVVQPEVMAVLHGESLNVRIQGCRQVNSLSLVFSDSKDNRQEKIQINNIKSETILFAHWTEVDMTKYINDSSRSWDVRYHLQCDRSWLNLGNSTLSKPRLFQGSVQMGSQAQVLQVAGQSSQSNFKIIWIVCVVLLCVIACLFFLLRKKLLAKICPRRVQNAEKPTSEPQKMQYKQIEMSSASIET